MQKKITFLIFILNTFADVVVFSIKLARELEKEMTEELNKLYKEIKASMVFEELETKLNDVNQCISKPNTLTHTYTFPGYAR